eukprot:TRINITY_DN11356_c0_g1_i1.p1 TRINITY_DN11356_c0_g1~~TRINITY_DN11356_c0_g1_i1.p1  ORF type:complete len:383 (+),score=55.14 TRINITY_DN11356_c0_g1_i1:31-1179(+)
MAFVTQRGRERLVDALQKQEELLANAVMLLNNIGRSVRDAGVAGALCVVVVHLKEPRKCAVFGRQAVVTNPKQTPTIVLDSIPRKGVPWVPQQPAPTDNSKPPTKPLPSTAHGPYVSEHIIAFNTCSRLMNKNLSATAPCGAPESSHSSTETASSAPAEFPESPSEMPDDDMSHPDDTSPPNVMKRKKKRKQRRRKPHNLSLNHDTSIMRVAGFRHLRVLVKSRERSNASTLISEVIKGTGNLCDAVHSENPPPGAGIEIVLKAAALTESRTTPFGLLAVLQDVMGSVPVFGVRGDGFKSLGDPCKVPPSVHVGDPFLLPATISSPTSTKSLSLSTSQTLQFPWACAQTTMHPSLAKSQNGFNGGTVLSTPLLGSPCQRPVR